MNTFQAKITFISAIIFILTPVFGFSQLKISGTVKDSNETVAYANVILRDSTKTMITGAITDEDGKFSMESLAGKYSLLISYIGYKDWSQDITLEKDINFDNIILELDDSLLDEVVIKAKKRLVEYKTDRLVFNVENSIAAQGGNALNAMMVAPGIIVQNNDISMLGKGSSRIMVNDRLIELSGEDLINYLNSIPGSDIKRIEVITNPPAKYEAAGNGGLINIILQKGRANSWRNSIGLNYDQSTYSFYTLRNNFLYNKDKFRLTVSASGVIGDIKNDSWGTTFYSNSTWENIGPEKQKKDDLSGRITMDYDLTDNTSIGVQYQGNLNNPDREYLNRSLVYNLSGVLDSIVSTSSNADLQRDSHAANIHLISKLDTLGKRLSFDVDYFTYKSDTDNNFNALSLNPDMSLISVDQIGRNIAIQDIKNYSFKVDMEHPLNFVQLSYGLKYSLINTDNAIEFFDITSRSPILDVNQSNVFEYEEQNSALYVNGVKSINDKLSVQLGLRLENSKTNGFSRTLSETNKNNYTQLFPSFYINYDKNENNNFSFNYGKRINRPSFSNLNPFRVYISSNSFSEGNPFLRPSFSDNFEISHSFKRKLRTEAFLNITSDGYGVVFNNNDSDNSLIVTRQNYFKELYFGIGESYTVNVNPWWQSQNTLYLLGSKSEFDDSINATPQNGLQTYFYTNNSFSLGEGTKMQLSFFYNSPKKKGLYTFGYVSRLNVSFQQSLFQNKVQLSVLFNDIFNTSYLRDYTSVVNNVKQIYNERNSTRFVRFSLTYNFGNEKINISKENFGNNEERNRSN